MLRPDRGELNSRQRDGVERYRIEAKIAALSGVRYEVAVPKAKLDDVMPVRFKAGVFARIDEIAGKKCRAKFIREVVDAALAKAEKQKLIKKAAED